MAAGALNTLFGFTVYSAAILWGLPVWAALLVANVVGGGFNFVTTGGYAFRSLLLSRFPRFVAAYVGLYLLNWALIQGLQAWVSDAIVAQLLLMLPLAALSYLVLSKLVFDVRVGAPGP